MSAHCQFFILQPQERSQISICHSCPVSIQAPITKRTSISERVPLSFLYLWSEEAGRDKRKQTRYSAVVTNAVRFLELSVCRSFRLETCRERNVDLKVSVSGKHISPPFTPGNLLTSTSCWNVDQALCLFVSFKCREYSYGISRKNRDGIEYWWKIIIGVLWRIRIPELCMYFMCHAYHFS